MPRVPTPEVADILAERLVNRGYEGSLQWVSAWCRRWGSQVAEDTATTPLFRHVVVQGAYDVEDAVIIGPDRIPINVYREWKDLQDGSRTVRGTADGSTFWED